MAAATEMLSSEINRNKVLLIGAGGWFGRTTLSLLNPEENEILCISSRQLKITSGNKVFSAIPWDENLIRTFEPSLVIDCAFLTRDRLRNTSVSAYIEQNKILIEQSVRARQLESVEKYIGFSSGASTVYRRTLNSSQLSDPYGWLKVEYEKAMECEETSGDQTIILRPWSVTGEFIQKPELFAFSNLILQSIEQDVVKITSPDLVYRRYVDIGDFIKSALLFSKPGFFTFDSGGAKVELSDLVRSISFVLNKPLAIDRPNLSGLTSDYSSDNSDWEYLIAATGSHPLGLEHQILKFCSSRTTI